MGPRQVGKTTILKELVDARPYSSIYASADEPSVKGTVWIEQQWLRARQLLREHPSHTAYLILDEVTKIEGWSELTKRLWDEDSFDRRNLHVVICGSSSLLMSLGLTESLAGRFERIIVPHWSYPEMESAFGFTLDQYLYSGGYPGAAPLINSLDRWRDYVKNSLIETVLARDILQLERIHKPALLRNLFELGCQYSAQELSLTKAAGTLEAGNTTTLSHYLTLLDGTYLLTGLRKYSGSTAATRMSTPKFMVYNTALISAFRTDSPGEIRDETSGVYGRYVESAVGSHLLNQALSGGFQIYYWRDGSAEVDFVVAKGEAVMAIEVKAGRARSLKGLEEFRRRFPNSRFLLIGDDGVSLEEFLRKPIGYYLK